MEHAGRLLPKQSPRAPEAQGIAERLHDLAQPGATPQQTPEGAGERRKEAALDLVAPGRVDGLEERRRGDDLRAHADPAERRAERVHVVGREVARVEHDRAGRAPRHEVERPGCHVRHAGRRVAALSRTGWPLAADSTAARAVWSAARPSASVQPTGPPVRIAPRKCSHWARYEVLKSPPCRRFRSAVGRRRRTSGMRRSRARGLAGSAPAGWSARPSTRLQETRSRPAGAADLELDVLGGALGEDGRAEHPVVEDRAHHRGLVVTPARAAAGEDLVDVGADQVAPEVEVVHPGFDERRRRPALGARATPGGRAVVARPVPDHADALERTEHALVQERAGLADHAVPAHVVADHRLRAGPAGRGDHLVDVLEGEPGRLLDQDVLAGGEQRRHREAMAAGRDADAHRVDLGSAASASTCA